MNPIVSSLVVFLLCFQMNVWSYMFFAPMSTESGECLELRVLCCHAYRRRSLEVYRSRFANMIMSAHIQLTSPEIAYKMCKYCNGPQDLQIYPRLGICETTLNDSCNLLTGHCEFQNQTIKVGETFYDNDACERHICTPEGVSGAGCGTISFESDDPKCKLVRGEGKYPECCLWPKCE